MSGDPKAPTPPSAPPPSETPPGASALSDAPAPTRSPRDVLPPSTGVLFRQQVKISEMTAEATTLVVPTGLNRAATDRAQAICDQIAVAHYDGDTGADLGYTSIQVLDLDGGMGGRLSHTLTQAVCAEAVRKTVDAAR